VGDLIPTLPSPYILPANLDDRLHVLTFVPVRDNVECPVLL
jgi:hypothetical protein